MLVARKCHRCGKKNRFDPNATEDVPRCERCGNRIRRSDPEAVSLVRRALEAMGYYFAFEGKYVVVGLVVVGATVGGVFLYDKYGPDDATEPGPEVVVRPKSEDGSEAKPERVGTSISIRDVGVGFLTQLVDAKPVWDDTTQQPIPLPAADATFRVSAMPPRFFVVGQSIRGVVGVDDAWAIADSGEVLAISPNGNLAATKVSTANGAALRFHARDGATLPIPVDVGDDSSVGVVRFAANDRLLVQTVSGVSATVSVWAPASDSAVSQFSSSAFKSSNYDISPDGSRLAIASPSGLELVDLKTGHVVVSAEAYEIGPAVSSCLGLAFSPEGDQLAALYPSGRLLVWDASRGRLVLDHGLTSPIKSSCAGAVQWLPNGRGWLLGGSRLMLTDPLAEVWRLPHDQLVAGYNAIIVDANHILLARMGEQTGFVPAPIPWEAIDQTRSVYSKALLKRGHRVQVLVTNSGEGEQQDALRLFRASLEERVSRAGFEVAGTGDVHFSMDFHEVKGADRAFNDRPYRDRRFRKVSLPVFAGTIALRKRGLREPLWTAEFATNGGAVPLTARVSEEFLRGRTLSAVQARIRNMAIPGYVPNDPDGRLPIRYEPTEPPANQP